MRHLTRKTAAALAVCLTVVVPAGAAFALGTDGTSGASTPAPSATVGTPAPADSAPSDGTTATTAAPAPTDGSTGTTEAPAPTDGTTATTAAPAPSDGSTATTAAPAPSDGSTTAAAGPTVATAGLSTNVTLDTSAVSVDTTDNTSVFHLAFTIVHSSGPAVSVSNMALAVTACNNCTSVAISIQVDLVWPVPAALAAQNMAVSVTSGCTTCDALAAAFQYVIATNERVTLTAFGHREVERIEHELRDLRRSGLSPTDLAARVNNLAAELGDVLATQLVPTHGDDQSSGDQGRGDQGQGDQSSLDKGHGDQGGGDRGHADQGGRESGADGGGGHSATVPTSDGGQHDD